MTVIVGLRDNLGNCFLGADSQTSWGYTTMKCSKRDGKLIVRPPYMFGITGTARLGIILRTGILPVYDEKYKLEYPRASLDDFMFYTFSEAIRELFKDRGYGRVKDNEEEFYGAFMVYGYGSLYIVSSDFSISPIDDYFACGSGMDYALGSLATTARFPEVKSTDRVTLALHSAGEHNAFVGPPYFVENCTELDAKVEELRNPTPKKKKKKGKKK